MADPVRATRQAVEAARRKEALMAASAEVHMALDELQGYAPSPSAVRAALRGLEHAADILETEIARADESRRIMDRGTDADAGGEAGVCQGCGGDPKLRSCAGCGGTGRHP